MTDAQTAASQDINCFSAAFASFFGSSVTLATPIWLRDSLGSSITFLQASTISVYFLINFDTGSLMEKGISVIFGCATVLRKLLSVSSAFEYTAVAFFFFSARSCSCALSWSFASFAILLRRMVMVMMIMMRIVAAALRFKIAFSNVLLRCYLLMVAGAATQQVG